MILASFPVSVTAAACLFWRFSKLYYQSMLQSIRARWSRRRGICLREVNNGHENPIGEAADIVTRAYYGIPSPTST